MSQRSVTTAMYYPARGGHVRISSDGAIVRVEGHVTICNSDDAQEWIRNNVSGDARERMLRATSPPTTKKRGSPIDKIAAERRHAKRARQN